MEIIIAAIVGYIAYSLFKSKVLSKSLVATEIQRHFEAVSLMGLYEVDRNPQVLSQDYAEQYWDKVSGFLKEKPPHTLRSTL